ARLPACTVGSPVCTGANTMSARIAFDTASIWRSITATRATAGDTVAATGCAVATTMGWTTRPTTLVRWSLTLAVTSGRTVTLPGRRVIGRTVGAGVGAGVGGG